MPLQPPGLARIVEIAAKRLPEGGRALFIGERGGEHLQRLRPDALVDRVRAEEIALLLERPVAPRPLVVAIDAMTLAPLLDLADALVRFTSRDGIAVVSDVVWRTAPTAELAAAFSGTRREKIKAMEAYEMQVEHAGFAIEEKLDATAEEWAAALAYAMEPGEVALKAAKEADARNAALYRAWVLRPTPS